MFELTDTANASNKRSYTVKDGSTVLSAGSEVLSIDAGTDTGSKNLNVQLDSVATEVAGSYTGTLRFVSILESSGLVFNGTNAKLTDCDGDGVVSKGDGIWFDPSYLYEDAGFSSRTPTRFLVLNSDGSTAELMAIGNNILSGYSILRRNENN